MSEARILGYVVVYLLGVITGVVITLSMTRQSQPSQPVVYESARREGGPGCSIAIVITLGIGILLVLSRSG